MIIGSTKVPNKINAIKSFVHKVTTNLCDQANKLSSSCGGHYLGGSLGELVSAELISNGYAVINFTTYDSAN